MISLIFLIVLFLLFHECSIFFFKFRALISPLTITIITPFLFVLLHMVLESIRPTMFLEFALLNNFVWNNRKIKKKEYHVRLFTSFLNILCTHFTISINIISKSVFNKFFSFFYISTYISKCFHVVLIRKDSVPWSSLNSFFRNLGWVKCFNCIWVINKNTKLFLAMFLLFDNHICLIKCYRMEKVWKVFINIHFLSWHHSFEYLNNN